MELDGGQHYENGGPEYDRLRTEYLMQNHGLELLRFTNLEIQQSFGPVCEEIDRRVKERIERK